MRKLEIYNRMESVFEAYNSTSPFLEGLPIIIIAGAARGIGKALFVHFLRSKPLLHYQIIAIDKSPIPPNWFVGLKNTEFGNGIFIHGEDCSDHDRIHELFSWFQHGGLGRRRQPLHMIVTIGNNILNWMHHGPSENFQKVINSNLLAPMVLASGFSYLVTADPYPPKEHRRTMTFFSSIAGEIPMRTTVPYCSAKAGLNMMIRCLARELIQAVEVYGITLGPTDTELMYEVASQVAETRDKPIEQVWDEIKADLPIGELMPIEEVVGMIAQIVSGSRFSIFNSGTSFRITGGRS
jgi:NAD(P)-dependent dehydrogenase (short-subunit alcohol dehydrogenase family)